LEFQAKKQSDRVGREAGYIFKKQYQDKKQKQSNIKTKNKNSDSNDSPLPTGVTTADPF